MAKSFNDIQKYADNMAKYKHKCKCGHTVYLSKAHPKKLCNWCGKMNFLNEKEEFKEKIKNELRKH